eukprot:4383468-Prymnesium_polylepis.1
MARVCPRTVRMLGNHVGVLAEKSCREVSMNQMASWMPPNVVVASCALYAVLGLSFTVLLGHTLLAQPLFPFQLDNAAWASTWLLTTVADYYTSTLCLCGVIVASD